MYLKLVRTKQFKKDTKNIQITDRQYNKFIVFIGKLLVGKILPKEAKDHILKGNWASFREFHLGGDILVIYAIKEKTLCLIRIGTHSQLFK